jgi:TatD DNase family protein
METDCPYLAPIPYRGKRNEPAFVLESASAVAAVLGIERAAVLAATTATATRFFNL